MEEWIGADQREVASAGAMDVAGLGFGHKRLGRDHVRCLTGAAQTRFDPLGMQGVPNRSTLTSARWFGA